MCLFIIYPAQDHSELDFFFMKICPVPVIVVEDSKKKWLIFLSLAPKVNPLV